MLYEVITINTFKVILQPDLVVVYIMCRSDLQASCPKLLIHILIEDKRYFAACHRNNDTLTPHVEIAFISRIGAYGSVTEYS